MNGSSKRNFSIRWSKNVLLERGNIPTFQALHYVGDLALMPLYYFDASGISRMASITIPEQLTTDLKNKIAIVTGL